MKFFGHSLRKISFLILLGGLLHVQSFGMGTPHRMYSNKGIVSKLAQKTSNLVQHDHRLPLKNSRISSDHSIARSFITTALGWVVQLFISQEEVVSTTGKSARMTAVVKYKA